MTITKSDEEHIQLLILNGIEEGMEKGIKELKDSQKEGMKSQRNFLLIILTIFLGVSGPLTIWVANQQAKIEAKVDSKEAYNNFLTKNQFLYLQKEEHKYDIRALNEPGNASAIFQEHNASVAEQLEIRTREARQVN